MKKTMRLFSILLALVMLVSAFPMTASAAETVVTEVRATVSTPVVGYTISKLNDTYTPTEGVEITNMNWTDINGVIYPSNTVFQAGVTYYCDIEFTVKDGYTFPNSYKNLTGYINSNVGEVSTVYYTDHAYVVVPFTPIADGEIFVGGIGMNDGDYLHVGAKSTSKNKLSDSYAYYNDGVLTLHNYTYTGPGHVMPNMYSYYSAAIVGQALTEIVVEGQCSITSNGDACYDNCIWFMQGNQDAPRTIRGTEDSYLELSSRYMTIDLADVLIIKDANLHVKGDGYGIDAYHGVTTQYSTIKVTTQYAAIAARGPITVTGGTLSAASAKSVGIFAYGDIYLKDVNANISSRYDAICTSVDSEKENSADISVFNSELTLVSPDGGGIDSSETLLLYNCAVEAQTVDCCLEAEKDLSVSSSRLTLGTQCDGIFCYDGNMFITSCTVTVEEAGDDGIECLGSNLSIAGSDITVSAVDCGIQTDSGEDLSIINSKLDLTADYCIYSEKDTTITTSTIKAFGETCGISTYEAGITITDSNIEATATEGAALHARYATLTVSEGLTAQAATQVGGTVVPFNAENASNYRWVKIGTPAAITTQPKTAKVAAGKTAKFTVKATGDGLKYQWQSSGDGEGWKNCTSSKATSATFTFTAKTSHSSNYYRCKVTDSTGNVVYTDTVRLYVLGITTQPKAQTVKAGTTAKLVVKATGDGLKYQWQSSSNGTTWKNCSSSTAKKATFTFTSKTSHNGNYYRCKVTDSAGNVVYTDAVRLYVLGITTQPTTQKIKAGTTAKLVVKAVGTGLKYQWQSSADGKTWKNCSSSTAVKATFTFTSKTSHNGNYYRCKVTDSAGNVVYTDTVRLYVLGITTQPTAKTVKAGATAKFTVKATGDGLTYQWQSSSDGGKTWKNCSSSTAVKATFTFTSKTSHNGNYYRCKVTDSAGNTVYTAKVKLTVKK